MLSLSLKRLTRVFTPCLSAAAQYEASHREVVIVAFNVVASGDLVAASGVCSGETVWIVRIRFAQQRRLGVVMSMAVRIRTELDQY